MNKLIRRRSRVSDYSNADLTTPLSPKQNTKLAPVPPGHVPVRVGDEEERFVISTELLNRPVFLELLSLSAQEYGYKQIGALRIVCSVVEFKRLLSNGGNVAVEDKA